MHLTHTQCPHGIRATSAECVRQTGHALVVSEASLAGGATTTRSTEAATVEVAVARDAAALRTGRLRRRLRLGVPSSG
jgi:hypothetical protein